MDAEVHRTLCYRCRLINLKQFILALPANDANAILAAKVIQQDLQQTHCLPHVRVYAKINTFEPHCWRSIDKLTNQSIAQLKGRQRAGSSGKKSCDKTLVGQMALQLDGPVGVYVFYLLEWPTTCSRCCHSRARLHARSTQLVAASQAPLVPI